MPDCPPAPSPSPKVATAAGETFVPRARVADLGGCWFLERLVPGGPDGTFCNAAPRSAAAALVALITVILNGVAAMYEARQETRRKEIERHSADTLAAAFARCIDDSHARAQGLTGLQDAKEAERVRDSTRRLAVDMTAAIAALVELPMTVPHRHAPKDDAKEADHLADLAVGSRPFLRGDQERGRPGIWLTSQVAGAALQSVIGVVTCTDQAIDRPTPLRPLPRLDPLSMRL
jgi:hypothetical protein